MASYVSAASQAACTVALGLAGVTLLASGANTVALLAGAVQRAVIQGGTMVYTLATGAESKVETKASLKEKPSAVSAYVDMVTPFKSKEFTTLAIAGFVNVAAATVSLYVLNRFCPALVTSANSLLHHVVGIQFTPGHIPLTRLAGL
jgi:hypothetical protein